MPSISDTPSGRLPALASLLLLLCGACSQHAAPVLPAVPASAPLVLDRIVARPGGGLVAGASTVDLTPYAAAEAGDVYIAGFQQDRTSEGVLDPVTGRVLYLDDGDDWVVLVSLDFVGLLWDEVDAIRALVTAEHGERVIVASTHNHQSPDTIGFWGFGLFVPFSSGKDVAYMEWMRGRVASAIEEAVRAARPARIRVGHATVPEGIAANLWFPDRPDAIDSEMGVIAVDGVDGAPIATLVNYAVHAEALFEINREISADLPGRVYGPLEERRGGGVALFFQGALGGMVVPVPNLFEERDAYEDLASRIRFIETAGTTLADVAMRALDGADGPLGPDGVDLTHHEQELYLPLDGFIFSLITDMGVVDLDQRPRQGDRYRTEVHLIDLGPARILTVPGEPFPSLGKRYKQWLATPHPFLVGLANDELGYIMTADEFEDDTYGYEQSMSMGPETGPLLDDAVRALLERDGAGAAGSQASGDVGGQHDPHLPEPVRQHDGEVPTGNGAPKAVVPQDAVGNHEHGGAETR